MDTQVETFAEIAGGTGGLVFDSHGNLYSADFGAVLGDSTTAGTFIYRIRPDRSTSVFAKGFNGASGIAIDSRGDLYQSNIRANCISKVAPSGGVRQFASDGIEAPVGIVIDDEDTLWVANCGSQSVQKVTSDGTSSRFVESPLLKCPNGITLDKAHNLYVANFDNGDVIKITPAGEVQRLATFPGANNGHIICVDELLYVVARGVHQIYVVSLGGDSRIFAGSGRSGGNDGSRLEASFCYPNDIAISADRKHFYVNEVADETTDGFRLAPTRIRRIER